MHVVIKRLGLLVLISLSFVSLSGLVTAQDQSTVEPPSTIQDPCWLMAYPPDAPRDDSLNASIEHKALQLISTGDNDEALTLLSRLIETSPDNASLYALRGCLYTRIDTDAAIEDWETFIDLSTDEAQIIEVERLIAAYLRDERACQWNVHYDTPIEARVQLNSYFVLTDNMEKANSHNLRGLAYLCLGYNELGLYEFELALRLETHDAFYHNRALAYSALGEYDKSIADFSYALELAPDDEITLANRGRTYIRMEQYEEALADYMRALEIEPNNLTWLSWRAFIYYTIDDFEACAADYTTLLTVDVDSQENPVDWMRRGNCYEHMGQTEQAASDYNVASVLEPNESFSLVYQGTSYVSQENYSEALDTLNRAIELDGTYDYAWIQRGRVYFALGEYEKALGDYNKALELRSDRAVTYLYRAYAYYALKDYDHATEDFETYLEMIPETRRRAEIEEQLAEIAADAS